ncbi:MAG: NACHT domain-containing protein [Streptococcaceae bacterium]|jgi:hypothetical protein|nr:NACHT domain-containing protein [Streptococcaceae bacterium]
MVTNSIKAGSEAIGKDIGKDLYSWGKDKYKAVRFKQRENTGDIYQTYLENEGKRISETKTILYHNQPKNLYDIYVPMYISSGIIGISETDASNQKKTDNSSLIFSTNNKIIITGTGGIGKSFMMKHIFVNQISQEASVPVFYELRAINSCSDMDKLNLEELLFDRLKFQGLKIGLDEFHYILEKGRMTFIFDGYDELNSCFQEKFQRELELFTGRYPDNRFVISSRPMDQFVGWSNFSEHSIQPLNENQAVQLIDKLDYDEEVKRAFINDLRTNSGGKNLFESHNSFASIPLLLNVMLTTYDANSSIPEDFTEFYDMAFSTLFQRHDSFNKGFFKRERQSQLTISDFKNIMSYIAMKTFLRNQVVFRLEDINEYLDKYKKNYNEGLTFDNNAFISDAIHVVCLLIQEGSTLYFSHRNFQEYFAANGVSQLTDIQQKNLLEAWQSSEIKSFKDNLTFMNALLSLQRSKTYLNFFIPMIEKLEKEYKKSGSIEIFTPKVIGSIQLFVRNGNFHSSLVVRLRKSLPEEEQWITVDEEEISVFPHIFDLIEFIFGEDAIFKDDEVDKTHKVLGEYWKARNKDKTSKNIMHAYILERQNRETELGVKILDYACKYLEVSYTKLLEFKDSTKKRMRNKKNKSLKNLLSEI